LNPGTSHAAKVMKIRW